MIKAFGTRALEALSGGPQRPRTFDAPVLDVGPSSVARPEDPSRLRIMTWNLAYGRGPLPGEDTNEPVGHEVLAARIAEIGALVQSRAIDLLFLQEVDAPSRRSCFIDQPRELARASGLRHVAFAPCWQSRYIPFPYWPPSRHYGPICSGGAILSRWPLRAHRVTHHPRPASQPWWYRSFYLFRYTQRVEVLYEGRWRPLLNNHLEAFDGENRAQQAHALRDIAVPLTETLALGGDLNTTPPEAEKKHGFSDEPRDDYRSDPTIDLITGLPHLVDPVPRDVYAASEPDFFTYPTLDPTRRLDYLFVHRDFAAGATSERLTLEAYSDHCPVIVTLAR